MDRKRLVTEISRRRTEDRAGGLDMKDEKDDLHKRVDVRIQE